MARHNRDGEGTDQRDMEYQVAYQPDWLRGIKVTRTLESGRQSTKTLFRNPTRREQPPGSRVRTRIASAAQNRDFEIAIADPKQVIKRITVETVVPGGKGAADTIVFTIDGKLGAAASR